MAYRLVKQCGAIAGPVFDRYVDAFNWRAEQGLAAMIVEHEKPLRAGDPASWLSTVWAALEDYRENSIPEGEPANDEQWSELTTAMAWISEALGVAPDPELDGDQALDLGDVAYSHAEQNYDRKGARYDVIVECMSRAEISAELEQAGIRTADGARAWADRRAGLHHEQELNQAVDGPESCIGSPHYNPENA